MQRLRALLACALLLCCWTASAVTGGNSIARHRARASQIANSAPAPSEQPVALPKPTNSTGTNSTSNSTQSGKDGIDLFQDLIQRVRENVAAEDRALKTYALEVNATCYATIARLNKTLEERLTTLAAANHTLTRSIRKLRAAQYHLNHLKPIIAKQEAMFEQVNNTLTFGNAHSSRQVELATNKSKDAQVVLSAVQAVFAMLSQLNGYNPNVTTANARFREQMQQAQNQVKDAQVLRFLETTLSSMAALPATLPSKEDIAKLRLLLSLLRSQILQYSESVQTDVKVETGLWNTRAAEYKQQLQLIKMNLERRRAEFKTQRSRGRLARLAIKASNETLTGAVFTEAQQLKVQVAFFVEDCRNKSQAYANQTANRADQLSTLAKLARVQFGAGDNDVMTRIMKGVKLPPVNRVDATGKRCCLFCETGKKPCGDKCILEEENCNTLDGCACEQPPGIA